MSILVIVLAASRLGMISNWVSLTLAVSAFTPFFLNDVVFPARYMPDQFKYFSIVHNIRAFDFDYNPFSRTVEVASWFLAFIPLPVVETIKSLGFYNRFLITVLIIWLYSRKNLRGLPLLFLLFYPSLMLYSSLSLRDTLVSVFMILPLFFVIDGKVLKALFISIPLYFVKFQNFFLVLVFVFFYLLRKKDNKLYQLRYFLYGIALLVFLPFLQQVIDILDFYRSAMYIEDGGDPLLYTGIGNIYDFVLLGFQSAPYFLIKPLPWEASSFVQLIQSCENIFLLFFLFYLFYRSYKIDNYLTITWVYYLFIAMTVYGLVVFNFGTAVRYKFPFVVFVVLGLAYDLHKKHGVSIGWRR